MSKRVKIFAALACAALAFGARPAHATCGAEGCPLDIRGPEVGAARFGFELGYQFARRSAERTLDRQVVFADSTYDVGLDTKSKFRSDQAFLTYRFAIQAKERTQLGLGVGVGVLPFKFEIDALASANSEGRIAR